jgi:hypothetical protein
MRVRPPVASELEPRGDERQRLRLDEVGAQFGQPALGQLRIVHEQPAGDYDAEDGVAEKFKALVGEGAWFRGFVQVRPMDQRLLKQRGIVELHAQSSL